MLMFCVECSAKDLYRSTANRRALVFQAAFGAFIHSLWFGVTAVLTNHMSAPCRRSMLRHDTGSKQSGPQCSTPPPPGAVTARAGETQLSCFGSSRWNVCVKRPHAAPCRVTLLLLANESYCNATRLRPQTTQFKVVMRFGWLSQNTWHHHRLLTSRQRLGFSSGIYLTVKETIMSLIFRLRLWHLVPTLV